MSEDYEHLLRIPVHFDGKSWVTEGGRKVSAAHGTYGELILSTNEAKNLWPVEIRYPTKFVQFLSVGAKLRFALSVRDPDELKGSQTKYLISPEQMWHKVEWGPVKGWHSTDAHFFEVKLGEPTDQQKKEYPHFKGGLLIKTNGPRIVEVLPSRIALPESITDEAPRSLNHAYTLLSEVYETHRMAHTGSIYQRVFYESDDNRWYPLGLLKEVDVGLDVSDKKLHFESYSAEFWQNLHLIDEI